jgi:hypothetical protein
MTPAQKEGAVKKSKTMTEKFAKNTEFQKRHSKGVLRRWRDPAYRKKISEARKQQHAKGKDPPKDQK